MPSPHHDSLNAVFRRRPTLALEVLHDLCGVRISPHSPARVESNDFNTRPSDDFTPDTVITVGPPRAPSHGVIVEIQQTRIAAKRTQLARYAASMWLQIRRPVHVLLFAPDDKTADYYAAPISTSLPGYTFHAHSVGPARLPVVTDPAEAAAHIEIAMFSVHAHGQTHPKTINAFAEALKKFPQEHSEAYANFCWNISAPAIRTMLEAVMKNATEFPLSAKIIDEARPEIIARARPRIIAEARPEIEAEAVLTVLSARGVAVDEATRERVLACTDLTTLGGWLKASATATSADDLFG
ncbi:hypothetical protein LO762_10120 [Actinocorallia sp. API 0066]|uniref:hypothetical protein n=1 Tax=Actinocorallia sp. API 0066 TaxID=2896846 RepID=UPI001E3C41DA|nr:hypothetical protein [Actinocorallia sp. API 0066]MCD0449544.1 hypothetical protein [Actinocorallia sp. API 0066]